MGIPFIFIIPLKSSGPISARPMSRTRITCSPDCFKIKLLNSSGVVIKPRARMVSSVEFPSILPAGKFHIFTLDGIPYIQRGHLVTSKFCRVEPDTHGISFFAPDGTALTPEMVCNCSLKVSSAISVSSSNDRFGLLTAINIIGLASASAFETVGGSQSRGNKRCACETLSRTSFAAVSKSTESSNSTEMLLRPWLLELVSVLIPGIPLMDCSSGSVICVSITSEFAPG
jgi:hypothetical protein